ncbi:hypothetical protein BKA64DRAFT_674653 [Cadophora sp. MPI-SDFR-AT-0126]|nr:hypothetical protein BKA64DRAFT_674653 [Leotiomycetes sp. MPI-SDFR-AT-0126]
MGFTHDSFFECSQLAVHVSNVSNYNSYLNCSRNLGDGLVNPFYINATDFNCSCFEYCDCPPFESDPDIAGIGVLAAFVVSAGLTIIATALHLLLTRTNKSKTINPIDEFFRDRLDNLRDKKWLPEPATNDDPPPLVQCLYDLVLSLSDTQLVMGIAMLSAAVIKLHRDSITVYHFNTVTNLAWLSSGVHILTLLVIRIGFIGSSKEGEQRKSKDPTAAIIIRVVCMLTLAGLLLYCSWISGYEKWDESFDCPAKCTVDLKKGGLPLTWMIISFVFILYSYPFSIFGLWKGGQKRWLKCVRPKLIDDKGEENGQQPKVAWRILIFVFWYIPASETLEVLTEIAWFSLGFYWTFTDRHSMQQEMGQDQKKAENNIRGFGQLVPLFLLLVPVLQVFESYAARSEFKKEIEKVREDFRDPDRVLRASW